jgi:long-chain acyl-CoA synthetase
MHTIIDLFEDCVAKYSNNIFLLEKKGIKYEGCTYKEVLSMSYRFAAGLITLGIQKGDRIALLSEGRNEWVISELGILYAGAINVPLSIKLSEPEDIKFRIEHSGSRMIIVSKNQVRKLTRIKNEIKGLEKVILLDPDDKYDNIDILYGKIIGYGEDYLSKHKKDFEKRRRSVKGNDYSNICYTSGTTADPKGIILSHRNYTANVEQSLSLFSVPDTWTTLLILPWDHSFAHTCGIYTLMSCGASMSSTHTGKTPTESIKNIPVNIKETGPHFLLSVPALAKNFRKNIEKGIREKGPLVQKIFSFSLNLAYIYNGNGRNRGKGLKILLKPLYCLLSKLIFSKIREGLGGRLKFFIGGGALLDIELQKFFYAVGLPMYQGYGLSEASPVISCNNPLNHKMGSSGRIVNNLKLKICDEKGKELPAGETGEIIIKGENVMAGYWKNEEATREAIKDGWLYTGDLGYLDKDNFLYVLGRTKSLLIADDGEKYSPEGIEEAITEHSGLVEQCMLYNNQKPYTVILIYPNREAFKRRIDINKINISSPKGQESVLELITKEINMFRTGGRYGRLFPQRWLPAAIGIIDEGFTEENHLLNSTLKMVRSKITDKFKELIEYLYTPEAKNICNPENIKAIRKIFPAG